MDALDRLRPPTTRVLGENAPKKPKMDPVWQHWLQDLIGGFALFVLIYAGLAVPYVLGVGE